MNEFKFTINRPRHCIDKDAFEGRIQIIAKFDHHIYPYEITNRSGLPTNQQVLLGVLELKKSLCEQILKAEFEYEETP